MPKVRLPMPPMDDDLRDAFVIDEILDPAWSQPFARFVFWSFDASEEQTAVVLSLRAAVRLRDLFREFEEQIDAAVRRTLS